MFSLQRQTQIKVELEHKNMPRLSCMINFASVACKVGVFMDKTVFIPFTVSL